MTVGFCCSVLSVTLICRWYTVTKVHTGHDEATLDRLQAELGPNMVKIKQDYDKVPVINIVFFRI